MPTPTLAPPRRPCEPPPAAAPATPHDGSAEPRGEQSERPTAPPGPGGGGATMVAGDDGMALRAAIEVGRDRDALALARAVDSARGDLRAGRFRGYAREVWSRFVALHGHVPHAELAASIEDDEARAAELAEREDSSVNRAPAGLVSTRISGRKSETARIADYIRRCAGSQYHSEKPPLAVWLWPRGRPEEARRTVAMCGSWRCDTCCRHAAAVAFSRISEAFAAHDPTACVFAVLTLDQRGTFSGRPWANPTAAFESLSRLSRLFLKRLNRWMLRQGWPPVGSRWVATVESHRTGWPHLNMVLVSRELADYLASHHDAALQLGASPRQATLAHGPILDMLTGVGWGPQCTLEKARSADALAGYVVKIASGRRTLAKDPHGKAWHGPVAPARVGVDATAGEVAKVTQRPLDAPKSFRRIRSGVGFLPPRKRSGLTGVLLDVRHREHDTLVREYSRGAKLWDRIERLKSADVPSAPWTSETFHGIVAEHRQRRREIDVVLERERAEQAATRAAYEKSRRDTECHDGIRGPPAAAAG